MTELETLVSLARQRADSSAARLEPRQQDAQRPQLAWDAASSRRNRTSSGVVALFPVSGTRSVRSGPEVARFEAEFARYCGVTHAVGVGSGLDAIHLVLRAWGLGPQAPPCTPGWPWPGHHALQGLGTGPTMHSGAAWARPLGTHGESKKSIKCKS